MPPFSSPGLNPTVCSRPLPSRSMLELPVSVMIWDLGFDFDQPEKRGARGRRDFNFIKVFDPGWTKSRAYSECKGDTMSWNTGGSRSPVRRVRAEQPSSSLSGVLWMKNTCSESQRGKMLQRWEYKFLLRQWQRCEIHHHRGQVLRKKETGPMTYSSMKQRRGKLYWGKC